MSSGKVDIPPLDPKLKTKDTDWILLCDDCGTSGLFDVEITKHKGHKHRVVHNPKSSRWK